MKLIIYLAVLCLAVTSCKKEIPKKVACTLVGRYNSTIIETNDCNCPPETLQFGNVCEPKSDEVYYGYSQGCDEMFDTIKVFAPIIDNPGNNGNGNGTGIGIGGGYLKVELQTLIGGKVILPTLSGGLRYYPSIDSSYTPFLTTTIYKDKECRVSVGTVYLDNKSKMRLTLYFRQADKTSNILGTCEIIVKKP